MSSEEGPSRRLPVDEQPVRDVSFAFGPAMYAWPYHFGVARYIQGRSLLADDARIFAASAGVLPAVLLLCDVEVVTQGAAAALVGMNEHQLGTGHPYLYPTRMRASLDWVLSLLPSDAHRRVSGRLFVSITRLPSLRRRVVSDFPDPQALIDVMLATMALPLHGVWLAFRSRRLGWCLDGGLQGSPGRDERPGWTTIHVSTLFRDHGLLTRFGPAEISPQPPLMLTQFLLPGTTRQHLDLLKRGYRDAMVFFGQFDR